MRQSSRSSGVRPLVLERLAEPSEQPKARGIGPLAAEALRRRGLGADLDREHEQGLRKLEQDHGTTKTHFAWIHKIDPDAADPGRRGALIGQPALEALLRRYLSGLGVEVRFGHVLTGLEEGVPDGPARNALMGVHENVLTVESPSGSRRVTARYVVGCDGGRSVVRKLAGFDFPGTPPLMTIRFARARAKGELPPPGRLAKGTLFHGEGMVATYDFQDTDPDRSAPLTADEMGASVRRVAGIDVEITDFHGGMRFTDQARQASTYRRGHTLLAGDAAHVHSPNGGQGLNLGLMDAMNLGWKLAAVVHGNDALLDTYTAERHPVGAAVLANTRAQSALLAPGPHVDALRDVVSNLMDLPEVNQHLSRLLSGVTIRHEMPYPATHPMTGMACPPLIVDGVPLEKLTTSGRPLLLHPNAEALAGDRVEAVTATDLGDHRLAAVLLRPDGVIAWASAPSAHPGLGDHPGPGAHPGLGDHPGPGDEPGTDELQLALDTWFRFPPT
ncbi:FAD-dependent monooxygenase [Actinoplanes sp. NPDC051513]|uniref:FAD-dependent monooxygenase n=1 Tax=Actinoplanes sp. NPDC051513 TaxID=3363908 RepID=UPI00378AF982